MEAENRQLKLQLLQKDMTEFVKRIALLLHLEKMQANMQQLVGRKSPDYATVNALNATWMAKYPNRCPTVIIRGKRRGEVCGAGCGWGKIGMMDFGLGGANEFDPCCDKHKWSAHPDYAAYRVEFLAAKTADEAAHATKVAEERAAAADEPSKNEKLKAQFDALLCRIDAQLQAFSSGGKEFEKLTKERASFARLEKVFTVMGEAAETVQ